uniref:Retrovirus-related Pol polyprotein from transposon TNT 1-94-like beta-barrel domain-containing protein n=1 Tax=Tanacetum cinerariifolium TaxID=118510 RepID=A0A6L2P1K7_TANCI|nr:hypothetical protein [Tanacetum cinerariifolium]
MYVAQVVQPQVNPDSTIAQFGTGRAVWHGACSLTRVVQFGTGRAVSHHPVSGSCRTTKLTFKRIRDLILCCVKNTVEDRIMDSGASFHATYCKEELERFKLYSGKTLKDVRYIPGLKRRLISVGQLDEEGYNVFFGDRQWIGMNMLASKGKVPDVRKVDIYFYKPGDLGKQKNLSFIMLVKTRKLQRSCGRYNANLQVKCLNFDNSGEYRLRITEEGWRGKDTSLAHLKVFGCDSFVQSHQVIQSKDITFMDSIYRARFASDSSSLAKPIQESQVVLVDIPKNLAENDSIVVEHGLSSKITQSLGGSSDTSERSENSGSFEDSGRSDTEDSKDGAFSKEGGSETPQNGKPGSYLEALSSKESVQWKKDINEEMVSLEKNQTCSLVRISVGKKASQRLWMFKVKEEQDGSKSGHGRDEHFDPNHETEPEPYRFPVGDEIEVEVLRSFNWPPSELITEDGFLPGRGYSQFNDVVQPQVNPDSTIAQSGMGRVVWHGSCSLARA